MNLDVKRIEAKVQFIQDDVRLLREMSTYTEAAFVVDRIRFYGAVHALQISIEAMTKCKRFILHNRNYSAPLSFRAEREISLLLDRDFSSQKTLVEMTG
jgi:hypothetical protein